MADDAFWDMVGAAVDALEAGSGGSAPAPSSPSTATPPASAWFSCRACNFDLCRTCVTERGASHEHALATSSDAELWGVTCDLCDARGESGGWGSGLDAAAAPHDGPALCRVSASQIAQLCGWGYLGADGAEKAFFDLLCRNEPWASEISRIAKQQGGVAQKAALAAAGMGAPALAAASAAAAAAVGGAAVRAVVANAVAAAAPAISAAAGGDADVAVALQEVVAREVAMGRGALLEARALDAMAAAGGAPVEARNDVEYCMRVCGGRVLLVGRIDGLMRGGGGGGGGGGGAPAAAHVVEVKNRTYNMPPHPALRQSDDVQCRAYLELLNSAGVPVGHAVLRVVFADKKACNWTVERDATKWASIEGELSTRVAERFKNFTMRDAEEMCKRFLVAAR
jgi:hypothetical protein